MSPIRWLRKLAIHAAIMLAAFACSAAEARLSAPAKVRVNAGTWHETDVSFLTGMELNRLTASFDYQPFKSYAVIFFKEGQAAVIRLDYPMFIACGGEFNRYCLPANGQVSGPDQQARTWEICAGPVCPI